MSKSAACAAALACLTIGMLRAAPALAQDPNIDLCYLGDAYGSLSLSAASAPRGAPLTLSWNAQWSVDSCPLAFLYLTVADSDGTPELGEAIYLPAQSGSMTVALPDAGIWSLMLAGSSGTKVLASVPVGFVEAAPSESPQVWIMQSGTAQREDFVRGVVKAGATVWIAGDVDLDLSFLDGIPVAPGVRILGDRSRFPAGPRIYTTTFPRQLLRIGNRYDPAAHVDDVHIQGIRFDGGEPRDPCASAADTHRDADAISLFGTQQIEIDHNELYRWRGATINVHDTSEMRINKENAHTVWVHDNYIHDNQHPTYCGNLPFGGSGHGAGYGVNVSEGAFAFIERNVFMNNRHAIAGSGEAGDGYFVFDNLFIHGGVDSVRDNNSVFNHEIDMHGQGTCQFLGLGESLNCGLAGQYMEIAYNSVLANDADAIQLRGTPTEYMIAYGNAFAQSRDSALTQTENGLVEGGGNLYGQTQLFGQFLATGDNPRCDFDGDGVLDPFRATGATMWYQSSRLARWIFVRRSLQSASSVSLQDFDGDNRCDTSVDGRVILNTDPQPYAMPPGDLRSAANVPLTRILVASGGALPYTWRVSGLPLGLSSSAIGVVTGTPVSTWSPVYTVTAVVTDAKGQSSSMTFQWTVVLTVPNVLSYDEASATSLINATGLQVGRVSRQNDCNSPGAVELQSPEGGRTALIGSSVNLTISTCTNTPPPGGGDKRPPMSPK